MMIRGLDGLAKVGSNTIAEVSAFEAEETVDEIEGGAMGDTIKRAHPGRKLWTGSVTVNFDPTDTNGQQALTAGALVTLSLQPEGDTTGDTIFTSTGNGDGDTVMITSRGISSEMDGIVQKTVSFRGGLVETTV